METIFTDARIRELEAKGLAKIQSFGFDERFLAYIGNVVYYHVAPDQYNFLCMKKEEKRYVKQK